MEYDCASRNKAGKAYDKESDYIRLNDLKVGPNNRVFATLEYLQDVFMGASEPSLISKKGEVVETLVTDDLVRKLISRIENPDCERPDVTAQIVKTLKKLDYKGPVLGS